jgi:hypothetical protein
MLAQLTQLAVDAVRADAWTIVERLLETDPEGATRSMDEGNTLLHVAAFFGASSSVLVLLRYGADAAVLNASGQSAIDLAFLSGHHGVVAQLRTGVANVAGTSLAGQTDVTSEVLQPPPGIALTALPVELHVRILSSAKISIRDVFSYARASKRLSKALDDAWLWEALCWSHWRCDSLQARRGLCTWKDVYKEQLVCHRAQARHREEREEARRTATPTSSVRRADEFRTPKMGATAAIVPTMATSIEELFEPLPLI